MSHYQKTGHNDDLMIADKYFENVTQFKYLRRTETNQSCMHKEIKSKLNLGNACYHSVQNLLSF